MDEIVRKRLERSKNKNIFSYPKIIKGRVNVTVNSDEFRKVFKDNKVFDDLLTNNYEDRENPDEDEE